MVVDFFKGGDQLQPVDVAVAQGYQPLARAGAAGIGGMDIDETLFQITGANLRIMVVYQKIAGIKAGGQAAGVDVL